ncbi:MAG: dienelactone hydrolase family protein [Acidobacteria bacterium]|nr:dienelactone hydrolase family protein [Acidobacteriota bacterium]
MITRQLTHNGTPLQIAGDPSAPYAVIVLQEAFGVNDHIRDVTERFAAAGYYAVAPELFHRTGSQEVAYDNFPDAMTAMAELNKEGLTVDLLETSQFLQEAGFPVAATAIVGFCMGGSVSFYAGTLGIVAASASFYGGGVTTGRFGLAPLLELAPELTSAWIGLYGDLDKGIPSDQVEELRTAVAATGREYELIRYPDADHGFHCDGRPAVFNAAAASDAYQRTLNFFASNLTSK